MKRVVLISGSCRKGNTSGITKIYAESFLNSGWKVKVIDLNCEFISFCDGCLSCDETQTCKKDDAMKDHIKAILESDLLVLGTPARWGLLSGELKTFIDRLNPYAACEGYSEKNAFIFALGQSDEDCSESIDSAINSVLSFINDAGMALVGKRKFYSLLEEEDYIEKVESIKKFCYQDVECITKRFEE